MKIKKKLLNNGTNYYFAPYDIKNKFYLFEPNFQKSIQPNDLINLIINYLHSEKYYSLSNIIGLFK
jgi:hypothetical protein